MTRKYLDELDAQGRVIDRGRVRRPGQEFTGEAMMRIVDNARCALQRTGETVADLAKKRGLAPAMVAALMRGDEVGELSPEMVACLDSLDDWAAGQFAKAARPEVAGWVRTGILDRLWAAVRWACQHDSIVAVFASPEAGLGLAGRAVCREIPGAVFTEFSSAGALPRGMLKTLAADAKIAAPGPTYDTFVALDGAFRGSGRLIFAGGMENTITGRQKDAGLQVLADLHERAGVPMVWAGTVALAEFIRAGQARGDERLVRIASLISWWVGLDAVAGDGGRGDGETAGGAVWVTVADVQRILQGRQLRLMPEAIEYLRRLASEPGAGGLRSVAALLDFAERLAGGKTVDSAMLRAIQEQRLGTVAAERLETRMGAFVAKAG